MYILSFKILFFPTFSTTRGLHQATINGRKSPHCKHSRINITIGRAAAQQLYAGFSRRRPGFAYGQHVVFVVDKAALGQVFSEYFDFPCQSFHRFLHYHNHPG
jgi:hypothetical protein